MKGLWIILCSILLISCSQNEEFGGALGEKVDVKYIGKLQDGTVFDTNVPEVAAAHGIPKTNFEPLIVTIGQGQVIKGFEEALVGMNIGDKKTITLPPHLAYGDISPTKIVKLNARSSGGRNLYLGRIVTTDINIIPEDKRGKVGEVIELGPVSYEILDKTKTELTVLVLVEEGDKVRVPNTFWDSTVVDVNETHYTVRQDPDPNELINTAFGPAKVTADDETITIELQLEEGGFLKTAQGTGRVTEVTEEKVTIDFNHPLAGETLTFEIEVVG